MWVIAACLLLQEPLAAEVAHTEASSAWGIELTHLWQSYNVVKDEDLAELYK